MAEVVLALAVVAFGLIAVLGVLPIGLNTSRDSRDETIIKHDVEFWMNAIRGGRLSMDALNHVEWVEANVGDTTYRAEYAALARDGSPDEPGIWPAFEGEQGDPVLPPINYRGTLKQASWRKDVLGWLSLPDVLPDHGVVTKFAKIRPLGSTLMNRLQSIKAVAADGNVNYVHPAGDLTFSYLLETRIVMVEENFWQIKLIARWPIIEEGPTADTVETGYGKKTFVAYINAPLEQSYSRSDIETFISPAAQRVFDSLAPGEPSDISDPDFVAFHDPLSLEQIRNACDLMADKSIVRKDGEDSYIPSELYETYGRFSLRSPIEYIPFGDDDGNFIGFGMPDSYFPIMYFFKPALDN